MGQYALAVLAPNDGSRLVAYFTSGNAVGVVLEPPGSTDLPEQERQRTWLVKIGVMNAEVAASLPCPAQDFENVIRELRTFLLSKGIEPDGQAADGVMSDFWEQWGSGHVDESASG